MNRVIKTILGMATMVLTIAILGIFCVSSNAAYNYSNIIELGEYPQTEVTDYSLTAQLNALGGGSTVYFEGERYKRVYFDEYTPSTPDLPAHEDYSYQDDNGYYKQTVYWFRYEPIRWRVLNNTNGELLMISEKILDAKPFNNEWTSGTTWMNSSELLYKFNIYDEFLGSRTLRGYSPSSNCVWTPRKDGEYTITVMVKNAESFGKYDALASFTVTVEAEEEEEPPIIVM